MNTTAEAVEILTEEKPPIRLVKRDGSMELLDALKLIKWGEFGRRNLGNRVNWVKIMTETLSQIVDGMTTVAVQDLLIKNTLAGDNDAHARMAGTLYAPHLQKQIYPDGIPTIQQLHRKLLGLGLMKYIPYSDAEYAQLEAIIDHTIDFNYRHFQIKHITHKYSIQNRDTKVLYETPQFTFMRMAMEVSSNEEPGKRIDNIREFYSLLNDNTINAPSPNYISLGTPQSGLVSCCLYKAGDTISSLNTGDTIAYRMTAIGAGIGGLIATRGLGEPVRGGSIVHQGKQPYFAIKGKAVRGNIQSGRAGAAKTEYNIFDVEAYQLASLQNPRTPANRRNRDMHFAVQYHSLFIRKALEGKDIFTFSVQSAPDLHAAFYGPSREKFQELYEKYEADDSFKKHYVNARDLLLQCARQGPEVGTHYEFFADNVNSNTPYKEPIFSSNLCVAPETLVMTDKGEFQIHTLEGKTVNAWNGTEFTEVTVLKTGTDQPLLQVKTKLGRCVDVTPYHKWFIEDGKSHAVKIPTHELLIGDLIEPYAMPGSDELIADEIASVFDHGRTADTFCFKEPKRNRGCFNGIVTGQCMEILQPTWEYEDLWQLFVGDYLGNIKLEVSTFSESNSIINAARISSAAEVRTYKQSDRFELVGEDHQVPGGELQVGMKVRCLNEQDGRVFDVKAILERDRQPETSLCALGGIVVANVRDDAHYERAMYHTQRMINYCILNTSYPFKQIEFTAKKRMNAAVGILGLATVLARKNLRYNSVEGLAEIHRVSERHMYFAIKCSIQLGRELGNAPWMDRTKWPEGWLPIDTYNRNLDEVCNEPLQYDWEALRAELIAQKGMRFSSLVAHMPTESSSKGAGCPNGIYPIRELSIGKSDATNVIDWVAPDSDLIGHQYQLAYDIPTIEMIDPYAVVQKFTDHSISADEYYDRRTTLNLSATDMIRLNARKQLLGIKTRYYGNSRTDNNQAGNLASVGGCASGACSL